MRPRICQPQSLRFCFRWKNREAMCAYSAINHSKVAGIWQRTPWYTLERNLTTATCVVAGSGWSNTWRDIVWYTRVKNHISATCANKDLWRNISYTGISWITQDRDRFRVTHVKKPSRLEPSCAITRLFTPKWVPELSWTKTHCQSKTGLSNANTAERHSSGKAGWKCTKENTQESGLTSAPYVVGHSGEWNVWRNTWWDILHEREYHSFLHAS